MIAIRGGMGLGDALYVQSVARHLICQGHVLEVCTAWPDVFRPLGGVLLSPFRRDRIGRLAHYSLRREIRETDQFRDCCIQAGIDEAIELRLDWISSGSAVLRYLRDSRPIILVQLPRLPMDRTDGYGDELLPDCAVIQRAIDLIGDRALKVQIGRGKALYQFRGLDLDLSNKTTVSELIDLAAEASGYLGYVSFMVPLAESLSKLSLFVWSSRGLKSNNSIISTLTPKKVIHRKEICRTVIDDCTDPELSEAVNAFLWEVGNSRGLQGQDRRDCRERPRLAG